MLDISHKWKQRICDLSWLVSFPWCNFFRVYPLCVAYNSFIFFMPNIPLYKIDYILIIYCSVKRHLDFFLLFGYYIQLWTFMSSFVWTYALSDLRQIPRTMLKSLHRNRMLSHPKFGLHVKTAVATQTRRVWKIFIMRLCWESKAGLLIQPKNC